MANIIKSDSLSAWQTRFQKCVTNRSEAERRWRNADNIVNKLKHWEGINTTYDEHVTIPLARSYMEIIRDAVYFKNPKFIFNGNTPIATETAAVLNENFPLLLAKMKYKFQTKRVVWDALVYGIGWKYNGYTLRGEPTNDSIKADSVYSIWVPHNSVFMDYDSTGQWDSQYLIMVEGVPYDAIKNGVINGMYTIPKKYKPEKFINKDAEFYSTVSNVSNGMAADDIVQGKCKLMHIFDRGTGTHRIICEGVPEFIYSKMWPLGAECNLFPLNSLIFNTDAPYPISEADKVVDLNLEANKMTSMQITHAKRFNQKYGTEATLTPKQKQDLANGYDGLIIEGLPENQPIVPIANPDINPAVYRSQQIIEGDMQRVLRISDFMSGQQAQGETTATEANFIQSGASTGIEFYRDCIVDFCKQDATILLALISENYDETRTFQFKGQEIPFNRQVLDGVELDITVDVESSAPPDKLTEKQEAVALVQMTASNPYINPLKPLENLLKTFKTVSDPKEWLVSPATLQLISQMQQMQGGGEPQGDPANPKQVMGGSPLTDTNPMMNDPNQGNPEAQGF